MSSLRLLTGVSTCAVQLMRNVPKVGMTVLPVRNFKRWRMPVLRELYNRKKLVEKQGPLPPTIRSTFLEWNYQAEWYAFGKRLNEEFDPRLLQRAFTHKSHIVQEKKLQQEAGIENPEIELEDNEELIEIGSKFMRNYIKNYVCLLLPKYPEEGKRALCEYLLQEEILAHVSSHIGTKDLILSVDSPPEQETLALTLKAVVGALLESSGQERTGLFVRDFIVTQLVGKDVNDIWHPADPISALETIMANEGRGKPEPRLINEAGRNTILAAFEVAMYSDKKFIGSGFGETIPIATRMAASDALHHFYGTTRSMDPLSFKLNPYNETATSASLHNINNLDRKMENVANS